MSYGSTVKEANVVTVAAAAADSEAVLVGGFFETRDTTVREDPGISLGRFDPDADGFDLEIRPMSDLFADGSGQNWRLVRSFRRTKLSGRQRGIIQNADMNGDICCQMAI
jgi:hypothetical protein